MKPPRSVRRPAHPSGAWSWARRGALLSALASVGCPANPDGASSTAHPESGGPKPESSRSSIVAASATAAVSRAMEAASGEARVRALDKGGGQALRGPEPVGGPWVTCYGNYRPTSTPERDVTRLGLLCGPANGMRLDGTTLTAEATDAPVEHVFDVRAGECFRVFAVADPLVPDLAVEVRNPKGVPVASDHNNDRWPILNPDGPFCLLDAGKHTIRVHARQGRGKFALQIWRLP